MKLTKCFFGRVAGTLGKKLSRRVDIITNKQFMEIMFKLLENMLYDYSINF